MKRMMMVAVLAVAGAAQVAFASDVGVGVDIHIGNRPAVVPVPVPAPPPPPVVIEEPPLFLYPPELGFGVAVDVPYDVYFVSGFYYLNRGDHWYRAPHYDGPWVKELKERRKGDKRWEKEERKHEKRHGKHGGND